MKSLVELSKSLKEWHQQGPERKQVMIPYVEDFEEVFHFTGAGVNSLI